MKLRQPTVSLLSTPTNFHGMLAHVWYRSRDDRELLTAEQYDRACLLYMDNPTYTPPHELSEDSAFMVGKRVFDTVTQMLEEDIPIMEHAWFVFQVENVPVAWREQAVRQRIGVRFGDEYLWEVIPGTEGHAHWSQTARIIPDHNFVDEGRYVIPESLEGIMVDNPQDTWNTTYDKISAKDLYTSAMHDIQNVIKILDAAGIPPEDTRFLSPSGKTHSISWAINLKSLKHLFAKRTCFIVQLGMWGPVLTQMMKALMEFSPIFMNMLQPPCFKRKKFVGCPIKTTINDLITISDKQPPCPIYLTHHTRDAVEAVNSVQNSIWQHVDTSIRDWHDNYEWDAPVTRDPDYPNNSEKTLTWITKDDLLRTRMIDSSENFERMWGLSSRTGEPL